MSPRPERSTAYDVLLRCYPVAFRARFGEGMRDAFAHERLEASRRGVLALGWLWVRTLAHALAFGGLERASAATGRGGGWFRDMRHGARRLRRSPGFALAAVLTLTLGVGGTAAMLALVKGVVVDPLPYPEAERLVAVQHRAEGAGLPLMGVSLGTYVHYRERSRSFDEMTLYVTGSFAVLGPEGAVRVEGARVGPGFFELLLDGAPLMGRTIGADDQVPGAPLVVVISAEFWRTRFEGAADVVGRGISIGGRPAVIVGVVPTSFDAPSRDTQIWLPHQIDAERVILGGFGRGGIARLRAGVTPEQAQADLERLVPSLADRFNPVAFDLLVTGGGLTPLVRPLKETVVGSIEQTLWILMGTVVFVLAIAAANVANLFLVRAESQRREVTLRSALGAGRGAIVRHRLSEALVVGAVSGLLGVGVAWGALRWVVRRGPEQLPRLHEVGLEPSTIAVAIALALGCALAFGGLPLLRGTPGLRASLAQTRRGNTSSPRSLGLRNLLVAAQTALALVLLVGSGLMVRTYAALRDVDTGVDAASGLVFQVGLPWGLYAEDAAALQLQQRILERLRSVPGVTEVGAGVCVPLTDCRRETPIYPDGMPLVEGQTPPSVDVIGITSGFVEALGIEVLEGRGLEPGDPFREPPVALVSRRAAERMWPGRSAIGQRIHPDYPNETPFTVVGVVEDVRSHGLTAVPPETLYLSFLGTYGYTAPPQTLGYVVKTSVAPESLAPAIRTAVRELDPNVPLANMRTMRDVVHEAGAQTAFAMILLVGAGLVSLALGTVGIYGVLSYTVSRRTAEIGVRIAMGARAAEVSGMVVRQGTRVVLAGVAIGLVGAAFLTRVLDAVLYGVRPLDPATFGVVTLALIGVALLASYLPARRAALVDPVTALRDGRQ